MTVQQCITELNAAAAHNRRAALKKLGEITLSEGDQAAVVDTLIRALDDQSITVVRQAVHTLSRVNLEYVPDELKILFKTTQDESLKVQILATIRRIEIEHQKSESGVVEWNSEEYVFSVTDFITYVNALLEYEVVQIKGEVMEVKNFRDQVIFFSLKDATGVVGAWFPKVQAYQWDIELQEGMEVVMKVRPQVSAKSGRFGLRVLSLQLQGEGSLQRSLEKLKASLEREGLFDETRKRRLPFLPRSIGLITGEDSAAYSDFVKVLKSRMGGLKIHFAPVRVQGVGSIAEVCGSIRYFNSDSSDTSLLDLIVLTRGGGSLEDLQAFNSEEVTRAVFSSRLPIVVAVGHEKDWSLAEYAADLRASTPSNAAELIMPHKRDLLQQIGQLHKSSEYFIDTLIRRRKQEVVALIHTMATAIKQRISYYHQHIVSLEIYFKAFLKKALEKEAEMRRVNTALLSNFEKYYTLKKQRFNAIYQLLQSYSPTNTLKRGYSVVKLGDKIIKSGSAVKKGQQIMIYPYKGEIESIVQATK